MNSRRGQKSPGSKSGEGLQVDAFDVQKTKKKKSKKIKTKPLYLPKAPKYIVPPTPSVKKYPITFTILFGHLVAEDIRK